MTKRIKILVILNFLTFVLSNQTFGQNTLTKEKLWTTDWSPNGKYIAIGGNIDTLKIYNKKSLKTHKLFLVKNTITRIKWHPSMNIIAVATQMSDEKSFILNLETNEKIELNDISPDGARGVDWNYTGEYLGVADNDGQILIYDIKGKLVRKFLNQINSTKGITALDWHPKKNILTTVTDKIRFLDINGNLIKSIKHRPEDVMLLSIAWHKSGDFFVTGDYGDEKDKSLLQYWNEQGELIKSIDISKGEFRNLAWNPKGDRLASASDALRIWDTKGNLISEGNSEDYLWGVSWNEQGNKIITSSMEQKIILWNKKAKRVITIE
ncbi:Anaphase-promoting complex subunit 4, WD40 domain containing protein [Flavobacteriaceae bacterium]